MLDMSINERKFRERLVELRKEKGYTQQALADLLNISVFTINSYEAKDKLPRFDMVIKLANALDCTSDYLLGITDINSFNQYGRFTRDDYISEHDFIDVIRVLNDRNQLDFYIDNDRNNNNSVTFQITDSVLTTYLAGYLHLKATKDMISEENFKLVYQDMMSETKENSLQTGKRIETEYDWKKQHYKFHKNEE